MIPNNQEPRKRASRFEVRRWHRTNRRIRVEDSQPDFLQGLASKMRGSENKQHRHSQQFAERSKPERKILNAIPFIKIVVTGLDLESRRAEIQVSRFGQHFNVQIVVARLAQESS
jgi:hypothetical protein